jgi:hypothetical protein
MNNKRKMKKKRIHSLKGKNNFPKHPLKLERGIEVVLFLINCLF